MSTRAEVVEEGAKVSRIIIVLCIKPETSKINVRFHASAKAQIFPMFPALPMGTLGSPITIEQC